MNGPLKFLTARKILPLLDLLAKFKRVLACSCSPNFCVARKLAKQIFYFCSCSQKNRSARKDHSSPLTFGFQTSAKWSLIDMIHLPDESICLTDPLLQKGWDVYWLAPTLSTDYVGFMERIKHQSFPIPHHKHNAKPLSVLCVWDMAVRMCKIL